MVSVKRKTRQIKKYVPLISETGYCVFHRVTALGGAKLVIARYIKIGLLYTNISQLSIYK